MNQNEEQEHDHDSNNTQEADSDSHAPSQSSNVTLKSIRRKLEDFQVIGNKNLGEGSYDKVKAVKEKATGHRYAMKIIAKSNLLSFASINNIKREIKI